MFRGVLGLFVCGGLVVVLVCSLIRAFGLLFGVGVTWFVCGLAVFGFLL